VDSKQLSPTFVFVLRFETAGPVMRIAAVLLLMLVETAISY